jgi:hypothetical protein
MSHIFGPYIPYGLFQTKGEMRAKFGSEWFRNVNLCKVQTNKLSALYIRRKERKMSFRRMARSMSKSNSLLQARTVVISVTRSKHRDGS